MAPVSGPWLTRVRQEVQWRRYSFSGSCKSKNDQLLRTITPAVLQPGSHPHLPLVQPCSGSSSQKWSCWLGWLPSFHLVLTVLCFCEFQFPNERDLRGHMKELTLQKKVKVKFLKYICRYFNRSFCFFFFFFFSFFLLYMCVFAT